jgi:hypothetical protein
MKDIAKKTYRFEIIDIIFQPNYLLILLAKARLGKALTKEHLDS